MDNEPYRDLGHHEAADLIANELTRLSWRVQREFHLPNGKVADVFCRTDDADFAIIEVKLELKASLIDEAWTKYGAWSNLLWFAVPDLLLASLERMALSTSWHEHRDDVGILGVYRQGLVAYRSPRMRAIRGLAYEQLRDLWQTD